MTVVGYPGPRGSHTAAATALLAPPGASIEPLASFMAVVEATVGAEVGMGVLPIENSLHGPVAETHDLLYEAPLSIVSEVTLPIVHCLLARTPIQPSEVRTLRSYPVAFDQCREFVHGSDARCLASATTADAAREVAESDDPTEAAIASERAARLHGLTVLAGDVGDHPEAYTRFVSVSTYTRLDRESDEWRTAFTFSTDHSPGALYRAIEPFGRLRINLHQLVSRPIPKTPWRYRFDAVLEGHPLDPIVSEVLREMRGRTRRLQVFGSYPAGRDIGEE